MIIQNDVHIGAKTTMKIGGYAEQFYIPESEEELTDITQEIYDKDGRVYILSGGSNLLINDRRFEQVVYMHDACPEMRDLGEGRFYIGASNRIQKVISFVNDAGYGGFEELVGLPAFFGGIIYMNAGIGGARNSLFTIGEFVENVRFWDFAEKKLVEIPKEQCGFGHRASVFQQRPGVILGAVIQCPKRDLEETKSRKEARLRRCKEMFEYGKGCFGTCFMKANGKILKLVSAWDRVCKLGKGRVTFGKANKNWLVNQGGGTFKDALRIINACKRAHRLAGREAVCEVVIWE